MSILTVLCPVAKGFVTTQTGEKNDCTHVKCEIKYSLGGHNWGTGQVDKRGYYLHVTPISKGENFESFAAFTGGKLLLCECSRRSSSRETLAKVMFEKTVRAAIAQLFDTDGIDMRELPFPPERRIDRGGWE